MLLEYRQFSRDIRTWCPTWILTRTKFLAIVRYWFWLFFNALCHHQHLMCQYFRGRSAKSSEYMDHRKIPTCVRQLCLHGIMVVVLGGHVLSLKSAAKRSDDDDDNNDPRTHHPRTDVLVQVTVRVLCPFGVALTSCCRTSEYFVTRSYLWRELMLTPYWHRGHQALAVSSLARSRQLLYVSFLSSLFHNKIFITSSASASV